MHPGSCSPPAAAKGQSQPRIATGPRYFPRAPALKMSPGGGEASDYDSRDAKESGGAGRGWCLPLPAPSVPRCLLGVVVALPRAAAPWRLAGTRCPSAPRAAAVCGAGRGGKGGRCCEEALGLCSAGLRAASPPPSPTPFPAGSPCVPTGGGGLVACVRGAEQERRAGGSGRPCVVRGKVWGLEEGGSPGGAEACGECVRVFVPNEIPAPGRELGPGRPGCGLLPPCRARPWALVSPSPGRGAYTGGVGPWAAALSRGAWACVSTVPKDRAIGGRDCWQALLQCRLRGESGLVAVDWGDVGLCFPHRPNEDAQSLLEQDQNGRVWWGPSHPERHPPVPVVL